MGKRKRVVGEDGFSSTTTPIQLHNSTNTPRKARKGHPTHVVVQIIAGTYERVLHGIRATVNLDEDGAFRQDDGAVDFADTFLFNAHSSAIRCLAISPETKQDKVILASGGSDQTINLYHLSARVSATGLDQELALPSLVGRKIIENPKNTEIGSLQHHAASVNAVKFPSRSKLLSAADDNTIAVARTRDWTILSTIKIPIPKAHGRPSGDTAPLGGTPAGVNDFAIHPSLKLMVSVSKGEKCMRLWNLVTGKKAGVLNFEKSLLQAVGEGRWGRGEGLKVEWDTLGEEFVVGFEKGAVVFGLDSKPKGIVKPAPASKIHQLHYVDQGSGEHNNAPILAVSTEDGRVILFSTRLDDSREPTSTEQNFVIPTFPIIGEIGKDIEGSEGRIKDFEILTVPGTGTRSKSTLLVTASSEGSIVLWTLLLGNSPERHTSPDPPGGLLRSSNGDHKDRIDPSIRPQAGQRLGRYETGSRITCLRAFVMAEALPALDNGLKTNGSLKITTDEISN